MYNKFSKIILIQQLWRENKLLKINKQYKKINKKRKIYNKQTNKYKNN